MEEKLNNNFVKDYYDKQVGALKTSYSEDRWFASKEKRFDYNQTLRTIKKALGKEKFKKILEIGPGDGVWSKIIISAGGNLDLLDQSKEMIKMAKIRLEKESNVNYQVNDFLKFDSPYSKYDLIFSSRCFEYFKEKNLLVEKMNKLLVKGGKLIIITKNSKYFSSKGRSNKLIHSDQKSRGEMLQLLRNNNFKVLNVYPAVIRWKSKYFINRIFFDSIHRFFVLFKGQFLLDKVFTYSIESYIYIAKKE